MFVNASELHQGTAGKACGSRVLVKLIDNGNEAFYEIQSFDTTSADELVLVLAEQPLPE